MLHNEKNIEEDKIPYIVDIEIQDFDKLPKVNEDYI